MGLKMFVDCTAKCTQFFSSWIPLKHFFSALQINLFQRIFFISVDDGHLSTLSTVFVAAPASLSLLTDADAYDDDNDYAI